MAFESDGEDRRGAAAVLTDEEGRFAITGLRRGAYRVLGEGLRGTARGMLPRVTTGERVTLRLASLSKLEGKVTAGGKPVREFAVEINGPTLRSQSFRDEKGAFVLERVDPGAYEVRVTAPEGRATVEASVGPEGKPVEVALVSMGKVIGKVLRADGSPLVGAGVALVHSPDAQGRLRVELRGDELPTTGADGSFTAEIGAGRHMLLVLGGGMGPAVRKEVEVAVGQVVDLGTLQAGEGGPPPGPHGAP
jgi:hypothetical protein